MSQMWVTTHGRELTTLALQVPMLGGQTMRARLLETRKTWQTIRRKYTGIRMKGSSRRPHQRDFKLLLVEHSIMAPTIQTFREHISLETMECTLSLHCFHQV